MRQSRADDTSEKLPLSRLSRYKLENPCKEALRSTGLGNLFFLFLHIRTVLNIRPRRCLGVDPYPLRLSSSEY